MQGWLTKAVCSIISASTLAACTGYAAPEEVFRKYWTAEALAESEEALLPYQSQEHVDLWKPKKANEPTFWHANNSKLWKPQSLELKTITINGIHATLLYAIQDSGGRVRRVDMVKEVGHGGWKVLNDQELSIDTPAVKALSKASGMFAPHQFLSVNDLQLETLK